MKKARTAESDELRSEYKRSDFGAMTRGRYAADANVASNVVVLDAEVAAAFPNDVAVNEALRTLIRVMKVAGAGQR